MQALISGGGKWENTGGRPAAEMGVDWLKQQVQSIWGRGAGVVKRENNQRPADNRGMAKVRRRGAGSKHHLLLDDNELKSNSDFFFCMHAVANN